MIFNLFGRESKPSKQKKEVYDSTKAGTPGYTFLGTPVKEELKEKEVFEISPRETYADALNTFQQAVDKVNKDFEIEVANKNYERTKDNYAKRVIVDYGGEKVIIKVLPGDNAAMLFSLYNDGNKLYNALIQAREENANITVETTFSNRTHSLEVRPSDTIQWLMENRQDLERSLDDQDAWEANDEVIELKYPTKE